MHERDKRYYTRYKIKLEGKIGTERGQVFPVEILDLSIEGARLKTDRDIPIEEGDIINLVIKWKSTIKCKAEVRWIKRERFNTDFGIKFIEISMKDRETLSSLISEHALTNLLDTYLR
ncbi:PilZ domain-containing protein [Thermodesulfobacterium sp. TA1]|uniref:PilZ domain-containing protein n=1 Tax=Thermodesulfobacterium sp. TA1 TaxID=2234087 RepID=UPI0012320A16|nr:PilZ domain-containing protein [Thermodesulfobacterium sp. TA1]QER42034.1 PilZ domain-containing protein [Thermodesulfobacterium sp. TA1]